MKPSEVLKQALVLFGPNGEHWVGYCPESPDDTHCAVTAIYAAASYGYAKHEATDAVSDAVGVRSDSYLGAWNDSHTWPEVKAGFEKAIAACEAEGR